VPEAQAVELSERLAAEVRAHEQGLQAH